MSTLMLHGDGKVRPTVRVNDHPDRDPPGDNFWTVNIKTRDLLVQVFFHRLADVEAFHEELGKSAAALREKTGDEAEETSVPQEVA